MPTMITRKLLTYALCCLTVFVALFYLLHYSSGSAISSPANLSNGCLRNVLSSTTFTLKSLETAEGLNGNTAFACSHFMKLSNFKGRAGNQMFQVASLIGTAINHGYTPVLPKYSPLAKAFDLPNLIDMTLANTGKYREKVCCTYSDKINNLNHKRNWTLNGFFQSWKYFEGAETVIRQTFRPRNEYLDEARSFMRNISVRGRSNVCLHYRRGDLLKKNLQKRGHALADLGYVHRAMKHFKRLFRNVQFIVLSDSISWCKEHIQESNVIFSPFRKPASDMTLMTLCDHVIITSGSFGWWGAWLAGGMTVYYKGFPSPDSFLSSRYNKTDYYPSDWIGLD